MSSRLTIYAPDSPVRRVLLDPRREYLIGRDASCDLHLSDPRISRRHARLSCRGRAWQLTDLGSKNGVQRNGQGINEVVIETGDWVSFGGLLTQFEIVSAEQLAIEARRGQTRWHTTVDRSRRLNPKLEIDQLLRDVLDSVLELAEAERGFIMLGDEHGELTVRARAARGTPLATDDGFAGSEGAVRLALEKRCAIVVCDARADVLLAERPSIEAHSIRALICVPLIVGEQPTGVVYADSHLPGTLFTELDVELLQAFAAHAALVVGVASVRDELVGLADLLPEQMNGAGQVDELVRRLRAVLPREPLRLDRSVN